MTQLAVATIELIRRVRRDYLHQAPEVMDQLLVVERLLYADEECAVCHERDPAP